MKLYSLEFAGIKIEPTFDMSTAMYLLSGIERNAAPNLLYSEFIIPNRDGGYRQDNRYEDRDIRATIHVKGLTPINRQANMRNLLKNWIGIEDKLIIGDNPLLYYKAKVYSAIPIKEVNNYLELSIVFRCSYAMYELYDDGRDYTINQLANTTVESLDGLLVNKSAWQNITARTVKTIVNSGNYKALPTILISGTADLVTVRIEDTAFSVANVNGIVYVDCDKMICYTVSGSTKTSKLTDFTGNFPIVKVGSNAVIIDGTSLNLLEVTINYPNTYIV